MTVVGLSFTRETAKRCCKSGPQAGEHADEIGDPREGRGGIPETLLMKEGGQTSSRETKGEIYGNKGLMRRQKGKAEQARNIGDIHLERKRGTLTHRSRGLGTQVFEVSARVTGKAGPEEVRVGSQKT